MCRCSCDCGIGLRVFFFSASARFFAARAEVFKEALRTFHLVYNSTMKFEFFNTCFAHFNQPCEEVKTKFHFLDRPYIHTYVGSSTLLSALYIHRSNSQSLSECAAFATRHMPSGTSIDLVRALQ